MNIRSVLTAAVVLAALAGTARADGAPPGAAATPAYKQPVHGMTMADVTRLFGSPDKKVAAVGDPPITRWIYPGYVVYFEGNIVLHSVLKARPFHDAPPLNTGHARTRSRS